METFWSQRPKSIRWGVLIGLALILGAGSFLRLWNLGRASLWVDETNTAYTVRSYLQHRGLTLPSGVEYKRAPLHLYATVPFVRWFGDRESSVRLPAAIFGIASILAVYVLGKRVFNRNTALIAAFFTAFSHFEIGWSRTARMYTLFQLLMLIFLLAVIKGFEAVDSSRLPEGREALPPRRRFLKTWEILPGWLVFAALVAGVSCWGVHLLTVFSVLGVVIYAAFMAAAVFVLFRGKGRVANKYVLVSLVSVAGAAAVFAVVPAVQQMVKHFLTYTPPWAEGAVSAAKRSYLVDFFISPHRFPLAAFFAVGSLQTLLRFERRGMLILVNFLTTIFLLTFVFTHRTANYVFHVYPLFLLLAAFGVDNLIQGETRVLNQTFEKFSAAFGKRAGLVRRIVPVKAAALVLAIFVLSPWFRISLHIPFNGDGVTNMAVTPSEWREAVAIVKKGMNPDDVIISGIPLLSLYYGLETDYAMDWALFDHSVTENIKNSKGEWMDMYSGRPFIETKEQLDALLRDRPAGWILAEAYEFRTPVYIPKEIAEFLIRRLGEPIRTKNNTVLIFHWLRPESSP